MCFNLPALYRLSTGSLTALPTPLPPVGGAQVLLGGGRRWFGPLLGKPDDGFDTLGYRSANTR
jgi:hypothetical protein